MNWLIQMKKSCVFAALIYYSSLSCVIYNVSCEKYKVCVVDGKGGFDRSGLFCPKLDKPESRAECVIGVDRLDCLRRLSKGTADFSVFTPEDLVTAANSEIEVLITNELRYTKDKYEYEIVAIIDNDSGITSKYHLKDKKFCHPGYGFKTDWTRILSNYLEASIIPPICQPKLTITENRIKGSSEFFKSACKSGPWVSDNPKLDQELKQKYPNLCALCDNPNRCSTEDKYWGRRGPLNCLTDGAGDITWARLDDVKIHFGFEPGATQASPDHYSYLCPDDSIRPLNGSKPCVWVVKPWPVIATKRSSAQDIQKLMSTLNSAEGYSWKSSLLSLIQTIHSTIEKVEPFEAIESYLDRATGFLNANSFSGCHPPRTIRVCTTSILENAKCSWLIESAAAYGIEPDLQCLKADNTTHCMDAVAKNVADIVMVPSDLVHLAESYQMKTLFYETATDDVKYLTVGVTKKGSGIDFLKDTQSKKACFPTYDGVAWNSVVQSLQNRSLLNSCPFINGISEFFGSSCVPNLPEGAPKSLKENCNKHWYDGEFGAIKCLLSGNGDVAFISKNSLVDFVKDPNQNRYGKIKMSDFDILCETRSTGCHLGWAALGRAMVRINTSELWIKDTLNVFMQLDGLFGKNYKSLTTPLQLFGLYNGKPNVLFHDNTARLRDVPTPKNSDRPLLRHYDSILKEIKECSSCSYSFKPIFGAIVLSYVLSKILL